MKIFKIILFILFLFLNIYNTFSNDYEKKIVEKINQYRKLAGLNPVIYDEQLSIGCKLHAKYLVINSITSKDFIPHEENPELSGYTEEGKKSAENSIISSNVVPDKAIDYFMATLFHRIPLLNPGLKKIGAGFEKGSNWGVATVIDIFSSIEKIKYDFILYPCPYQEKVPVVFGLEKRNTKINEYPDPLAPDQDKSAGYPVTITFSNDKTVRNVIVQLKDQDGNKIPVWISTPENPIFDKNTQQNTIGIISKDPLQYDTIYIVFVEAKINGNSWKKEWIFKTINR